MKNLRNPSLIYLLPLLGLFIAALVLLNLSDREDPRLAQAADLEKVGDLHRANGLYESVLADSPDNLPALRGLAVNYMIAGEYDKALPLQSQIVALDASDAQTRVELAFNYSNHQASPEVGLKYMKQAAALEPSAKHLTFEAQLLHAVGKAAEATQALEEVVDSYPEYAYARQLLESYK